MIIIRIAKKEDFQSLIELDKHISTDVIQKKIERKEIVVLLIKDEIIGWLRYSMFWDEHPFMNMLYIHERQRENGYGNQLLSFWEEKMIENGFSTLMLSTLSSEKAQHFYRNNGYKDIGGFLMPHEPLEIIMIKEID